MDSQQEKLFLPITLIGVDNFRPSATAEAMVDAMVKIKFEKAILACLSGSELTHGWQGISHRFVPMGQERLDREKFMIYGLADLFTTKHALHMEWDSRILNPGAWNPRWFDYDFIGAPWPWFKDNNVGNTGFALYSHRFCQAVKELATANPPSDSDARLSDVYICRSLRPELQRMGMKFAPQDVAARFSCEGRRFDGQFGWHGQVTARLNAFRL